MHSSELYEIEYPEGLRFTVERDLRQLGDIVEIQQWVGKNSVQILLRRKSIATLMGLRSVNAVYRVIRYDIPRPKALLGHQHLQLLFRTIEECIRMTDSSNYHTVHLAAAGSDTAVMRRIHNEIANHFQLESSMAEGDLWIRIRRSPPPCDGWDVLVRITPRPLSTRHWRVCNFQGALSAPVAYSMVLLARPEKQSRFLNIGCGSATILIEGAIYQPENTFLGCDVNLSALDCARNNITASGVGNSIQLMRSDMQQLPFPDHSIDTICADLPFGQLVGDHVTNRDLYPRTLQEVARIATSGARFVLITHEIRLMAQILKQNDLWIDKEQYPINLNGLHPRIYVLERKV